MSTGIILFLVWVIYTIVACIILYHSVQSHCKRLGLQLKQLGPQDDKEFGSSDKQEKDKLTGKKNDQTNTGQNWCNLVIL